MGLGAIRRSTTMTTFTIDADCFAPRIIHIGPRFRTVRAYAVGMLDSPRRKIQADARTRERCCACQCKSRRCPHLVDRHGLGIVYRSRSLEGDNGAPGSPQEPAVCKARGHDPCDDADRAAPVDPGATRQSRHARPDGCGNSQMEARLARRVPLLAVGPYWQEHRKESILTDTNLRIGNASTTTGLAADGR